MRKEKQEINDLILLTLYKELTEYFIQADHNLEECKETDQYIYDPVYLKFLIDQTNNLKEEAFFPKEVIERFKKLILKYKTYVQKTGDEEISQIYDIILSNLNEIDKYSFDYLSVDFEAKYEKLGSLNKLSGVKIEDMALSMNADAAILINIINNEYYNEIDDKRYLLAIKKIIYLYSDLLKAPYFKKNIQRILKRIINKDNDEGIKKTALKLSKIVSMKQGANFSVDAFVDFYYMNLITGLVTNVDFKEYFSKLDEKEILHPIFIDSLKFVIELYKDVFDKRIASNLLDIVNYIQIHYKDYYSTNLQYDINEMKTILNSYHGDNRDFIWKNLFLKENAKVKLQAILNSLNAQKHLEWFKDIIDETLEDEYFFSIILKSFMVSEEEFYNEYHYRLVFDDEYVKNIRKLIKLFPAAFTDDQVYSRTKRVIEDKIKGLKENGLLNYSFRREHEKVLKKINKYNVD